MPKVSIIMNCLNGERYLREALDSIYAQTYKDWEIIFWDNASFDKSGDIAKSYGEKVKYFKGGQTVPLGTARNLALRKASCEYIGFLDCDDYWMPDKLEKQVELFEKNPNVGFVFSDAVIYHEGRNIPPKNHFFKNLVIPRGKNFKFILANYFHTVAMPTVMVSKKALLSQDEWFDERFQICTDLDLFLRIIHDWEYDYIDIPLAKYRVHENSTMNKMSDLVPKELWQTLEKLDTKYKGFMTEYCEEINMFKEIIDYLWGKYYWMNGDKSKARSYYRKHLYMPKMFFSFIATFLPYGMMSKIWYKGKEILRLLKLSKIGLFNI